MKTSIVGTILSAIVILVCYVLFVPDQSTSTRPTSNSTHPASSSSSDDSALGNLK